MSLPRPLARVDRCFGSAPPFRANPMRSPKCAGKRERLVHTSSSAPATGPLNHHKSDVLVVGGGPAGLATALMLSKRGWKNVTVIEKLPSLEHEDPSKSYMYAIDGRGRKATDLLGLTPRLKEVGLETSAQSIIRVPVSGPIKHSSMQIKDPSKVMCWLPRKALLRMLQAGVHADEEGTINIIAGASCSEIRRTADGVLQVVATVGDAQVTYEPNLLVGADGLNSAVRQTLEKWDPSGRFAMQKVDSPAAGLRYKVLVLPPNPPANKDGSATLPNDAIAVLEGKGIRMGLLPMKDLTIPRTGNIILKPDHPFWNITTVDAFYAYLEECFPQTPIRELIPEEQAQRLVASPGGRFPMPQSCSAMHMLISSTAASGQAESKAAEQPSSSSGVPISAQGPSSSTASATRTQAVLLVGDAVHCFPPDLGQGVNSAMEDIAMLHDVLEESGDRLDVALPKFERQRMPDVKALIRLMQIGYPHQYNQDPQARSIWTVGFMIRLALSKLLPFLIAPPAFMMVQDAQVSYSQIMERAERTTTILKTMLGAAVLLAAILLVKAMR